MLKKITILILFIGFSSYAYCQFYMNGQDEFSTKWRIIKTEHFKVIFADEISETGQYYANYLEHAYKKAGKTLGHENRKIPVIIHHKNIFSNGEVAWAPKRVNLYIIPPQLGDAESYKTTLILHELRHAIQIDKLNQSSSRAIYFLLGEQAIGAILGWHIPLWFFEGDAVAYETGATYSGRGCDPDFEMKLKAQVIDKKIYSYPKAQFGSYKDFVPNHYELGYQLIAHGRQKYGWKIWDTTLTQVSRSPININAFSKGIKKYTGLPERKFYTEGITNFRNKHSKPDSSHNKDFHRDYNNYCSPHSYKNYTVCHKTSYNLTEKIILIDSVGNEKVLTSPGYIQNSTISCNDSIIVWNETRQTRWENKNYSLIVKYNIETGKKIYITKKTRAFQSQISPDNSMIVSSETSDSLNWSITIRNSTNGEIVKEFNFSNTEPVQPSFSPCMKYIAFMSVNLKGKSLCVLNIESGNISFIIKDQPIFMSYPKHLGEHILIKGVHNQKTNLLLYNIKDEQWSVLTSSNYGVGEGNIKKNTLIYSTYTANGYRLDKKRIDFKKLNNIDAPETYTTNYSQLLKNEEELLSNTNNDSTYRIKKYSRLENLVNIHSWAPFYLNLDNISASLGITIMSQNDLSTASFAGGYKTNYTFNNNEYYINANYLGFFPTLSANLTHSEYSINELINNTVVNNRYEETSFAGSVLLPFNLSKGNWSRRLRPMIEYKYSNFTNSDTTPYVKTHSIKYQLYFSNNTRLAYRNLYPRWGQIFNIQHIHSPTSPEVLGNLSAASTTLYFPGILKNNGLKVYAGYQYKEFGEYAFTDMLLYPYGYQSIMNNEMIALHGYYALPLLYPDLNVWELLYLKRIKATLFYQYSNFRLNKIEKTLYISSCGADIIGDMHLFRFVFPMQIGFRYARMLTANDNYYALLLSIDF